ncbi:MAG: hypothetical protein ACE3JK_01100 [Sporolactobacillus sp.]
MGFIENVRRKRNMPWLKCGMKVEVNGKLGTVTGGNESLNINVQFEKEENKRSGNCHPKWKTRYFDNQGNMIADYR